MTLANQWHHKEDAVFLAREIYGEGGVVVGRGGVKLDDHAVVYMCKKFNLPFGVKIMMAKDEPVPRLWNWSGPWRRQRWP